LKIIPDCFLGFFCVIIKNSNLFHLVHNRKEFIVKYFEKFPNDVFKNCRKDRVYLKYISFSLINWNNHLIQVFYECKKDILHSVALFYGNRKLERQKIIGKVTDILSSSKNKFADYIRFIEELQNLPII
jgi:hypothetical protein